MENPNLLGNLLNRGAIITRSDDVDDVLMNHVVLTRMHAGLSSHRRAKAFNTNNSKDTVDKLLERLQQWPDHTFTYMPVGTMRVGLLQKPTSACAAAVIKITRGSQGFGITAQGEYELVEVILEMAQKEFQTPGSLITTLSDVAEGARAFITSTSFVPHTSDMLGHDVFYPFLKIPMVEYMKAYMEARANVLVLIGPPGTGKSTFLRTLIARHTEYAMLAYNKQVLQSPKLLDHYISDEDTVLGLEDVDAYIDAREAGNTIMAGFLNASDGVALYQKGKKIVFSTNLPSIEKIDPALLRRGRCFDVLEFRHLTTEEAYNIAEEMKLPERDYYSRERWTLADVLNPPHDFLGMSERVRNGMGFV